MNGQGYSGSSYIAGTHGEYQVQRALPAPVSSVDFLADAIRAAVNECVDRRLSGTPYAKRVDDTLLQQQQAAFQKEKTSWTEIFRGSSADMDKLRKLINEQSLAITTLQSQFAASEHSQKRLMADIQTKLDQSTYHLHNQQESYKGQLQELKTQLEAQRNQIDSQKAKLDSQQVQLNSQQEQLKTALQRQTQTGLELEHIRDTLRNYQSASQNAQAGFHRELENVKGKIPDQSCIIEVVSQQFSGKMEGMIQPRLDRLIIESESKISGIVQQAVNHQDIPSQIRSLKAEISVELKSEVMPELRKSIKDTLPFAVKEYFSRAEEPRIQPFPSAVTVVVPVAPVTSATIYKIYLANNVTSGSSWEKSIMDKLHERGTQQNITFATTESFLDCDVLLWLEGKPTGRFNFETFDNITDRKFVLIVCHNTSTFNKNQFLEEMQQCLKNSSGTQPRYLTLLFSGLGAWPKDANMITFNNEQLTVLLSFLRSQKF